VGWNLAGSAWERLAALCCYGTKVVEEGDRCSSTAHTANHIETPPTTLRFGWRGGRRSGGQNRVDKPRMGEVSGLSLHSSGEGQRPSPITDDLVRPERPGPPLPGKKGRLEGRELSSYNPSLSTSVHSTSRFFDCVLSVPPSDATKRGGAWYPDILATSEGLGRLGEWTPVSDMAGRQAEGLQRPLQWQLFAKMFLGADWCGWEVVFSVSRAGMDKQFVETALAPLKNVTRNPCSAAGRSVNRTQCEIQLKG